MTSGAFILTDLRSGASVTVLKPDKLGVLSGIALVICTSAAAAIAVVGAPFDVLLVALPAAGLLALALPPKVLAWMLGTLIPIYVTVGIPPVAFDAARYGLVLVLLVRAAAEVKGLAEVRRWVLALAALGALTLGVSAAAVDVGGATAGGVLLASLVGATILVRRPSLRWPLLIGFACGATLNAAVVLLEAAGVPTIAPPPIPGIRIPGIGFGTTLGSYQLAAAVVVLFVLVNASGPKLRTAAISGAMVACVGAMLVNGGRGGVIALVAALAALARVGAVRIWHAVVGFVLGAVTMFWVIPATQGAATTLERLVVLSGPGSDLKMVTTGRMGVSAEAVGVILRNPLGFGLDRFAEAYGLSPHFFPLTFGVAAGLLGAVIALYLVGKLVLLIVRRPAGRTPDHVVGYGLAAVMVVNATAEPMGTFVGLGRLTLLFLAVHLLSRPRPESAASSQRNPPTSGALSPVGSSVGRPAGDPTRR